ncbi:MAG: ABC transporter permease [Egibacteraceae bacterium]
MFFQYLQRNWDDVLELMLEHAVVVAVSIVIAGVVGVGLGVLTYRSRAAREVALRVASVVLTIPSLALYALLVSIPFLGIGPKPVVLALSLYALLPIVRNTVTGLLGVDSAIVESAQGMGMSRWQRILRIELPLAWPVIITGIRVSTLIIIGIATLGAIINGPGLGELVFRGLSSANSPFALDFALAGLLGAVVLGAAFDGFFFLISRLTTSRGVQ